MRWSRGAAALLGGLVALALLAGTRILPRAAAELGQRGHERLLVVGVPLWLPPFGAPGRAGGWVGLDVEIARQTAGVLLGNPARARLLPLEPGERLWTLEHGGANMVSAAYVAPSSQATPPGMRLIGPYLSSPVALLVPRGQPLRSWAQLDGRELGVLGGEDRLRTLAGPAVHFLAEPLDAPGLAASQLALGRFRAVVGPLPVLTALARYDPALSVQRDAALGDERFWVLVPAADLALAQAVSRALALLPRGAAMDAALMTWTAEASGPPALLTLPGGGA